MSPKLKKEIDVQGQEANRIPNKMHSNRPIVRHIIKMSVLRGKFTAIQDFIRKQENFQKKNHPTYHLKECSNYHTVAFMSHARKVMLKILQARLQQ